MTWVSAKTTEAGVHEALGRVTSPLSLMQKRRRCLAGLRAPSARPPGEAELS